MNVDMHVMRAFVTFYRTLLGFVLFKLFHMLGITYPLRLNASREADGQVLSAVEASATGASAGALSFDALVKAAMHHLREGVPPETFDAEALAKFADGPDPVGKDGLTANQGDAIDADAEDADQDSSDSADDSEEEEGIEGHGSDASSEARDADDDPSSDDESDGEEPQAATPGVIEMEAARGNLTKEDMDMIADLRADERAVYQKQRLLDGEHVWVGRECPFATLEFLVRAMGGQVSWESCGDGVSRDDPAITIEVCDRPTAPEPIQGSSRRYVQPQWLFDALNAAMQLPAAEYAPGKSLPPHLSPFVDDEAESYVPERRDQLMQLMRDAAVLEADQKDSNAAEDEVARLQRLERAHAEEMAKEVAVPAAAAPAVAADSADHADAELDEDEERRAMQLTSKERRRYHMLKRSEKRQAAETRKLKDKAKKLKKAPSKSS